MMTEFLLHSIDTENAGQCHNRKETGRLILTACLEPVWPCGPSLVHFGRGNEQDHAVPAPQLLPGLRERDTIEDSPRGRLVRGTLGAGPASL